MNDQLDYGAIARAMSPGQRRHLKAIATGEAYPFSATIVETLLEAQLIFTRDGRWFVTPVGQGVVKAIRH